ncbi:DUF3221 domain-containing protein [Domibacillus indicus]|uniref:DUF3221 domain-containing protein n=1 Tax=Domibacillus indicus TaxID=1437523 RepID=UPI0025599CEC|nr:DUF3221 domain-containing protein [Domibacillus indicus]
MIWFFDQRVSEGYVLSAEGSRVLVIPMSDTDVEEKTEKEIIAALEDKDIQSQGTYYDIPLINRTFDTNFQKGQKVKVYWTGYTLESAPAQVKDTLLMIKAH